MAVTFGFYNSKNGDRVYNAEQMSSIFSGIIKDGVFEDFPASGNHLAVSAGTGLQVVVGPGRAWFNHTWTDNSDNLSLPVDTADNLNDRIDTVVLEINKNNNAHGSVPGRSNAFIVVKGTPAAAPVRATLIRENGVYQYPIAIFRVSRGATSISSDHIYNLVGVDAATPFILNAVGSVSAANVLAQWRSAVDQKIQNDLDAYLEDDGSALYTKIHDALDPISNKVDSIRKIWLYVGPISERKDDESFIEAYSTNRDDPWYHQVTMYPNFWSETDVSSIYPEYGDIVIGSNGYYAIVTSIDYEPGYFHAHIKALGRTIFTAKEDLDVTFYHDGNNNLACSVELAEIRDAYDEGRKINVYCINSNNYVIGPLTGTILRNEFGIFQGISAYYSDIMPDGINPEDWAWDYERYTYTQNGITYASNSQ